MPTGRTVTTRVVESTPPEPSVPHDPQCVLGAELEGGFPRSYPPRGEFRAVAHVAEGRPVNPFDATFGVEAPGPVPPDRLPAKAE